MFASNSRYYKAGTYVTKGPRGEDVTVTRIPAPRREPLAGSQRRQDGQRLDLIAFHFLKDASQFWRLCDVSDAPVPDVLGNGEYVGIPRTGA